MVRKRQEIFDQEEIEAVHDDEIIDDYELFTTLILEGENRE